jgi:hypothetical protein
MRAAPRRRRAEARGIGRGGRAADAVERACRDLARRVAARGDEEPAQRHHAEQRVADRRPLDGDRRALHRRRAARGGNRRGSRIGSDRPSRVASQGLGVRLVAVELRRRGVASLGAARTES